MEHRVEVIEVGEVSKHDNADKLEVIQVFGYPVVAQAGIYKQGDRAIYIPIDSVMPDQAQWAFLNDGKLPLGKRARIKAKKLRGVFSMGMLAPVSVLPAPGGRLGEHADVLYPVGDNVATVLGITKFQEPDIEVVLSKGQKKGAENIERDPGFIPKYTDIDDLRRYSQKLDLGEEVVITEKIHGANARFCSEFIPSTPDVHETNQVLYVGSHKQFKKYDENNMWWKVAIKYDLAEKLKSIPGVVLYGEVYGWVQDLKYGAMQPGVYSLRIFDAFDSKAGKYLNYDALVALCRTLDLLMAPALYRGPWEGIETAKTLAEGRTAVDLSFGADNIKEGVVVRPVEERWDKHTGRVIFKYVSEAYHTRQNASEAK